MRSGPRPHAAVETAAFGLLVGPTASEGGARVGSATSTRVDSSRRTRRPCRASEGSWPLCSSSPSRLALASESFAGRLADIHPRRTGGHGGGQVGRGTAGARRSAANSGHRSRIRPRPSVTGRADANPPRGTSGRTNAGSTPGCPLAVWGGTKRSRSPVARQRRGWRAARPRKVTRHGPWLRR
jgi:hypothetical protein